MLDLKNKNGPRLLQLIFHNISVTQKSSDQIRVAEKLRISTPPWCRLQSPQTRRICLIMCDHVFARGRNVIYTPRYVCVQWRDLQSSSWDRSEEWVSHKEARLQLGKMLQKTIKIIFPSLQKMNNNPLKFCSWKQVDLEGIAFCRYWSVQAVGSWKPPCDLSHGIVLRFV